MKKLTKILELKSDDELFDYITSNLKLKGITQWDYFVNWEKVINNVTPYEVELNILNVLIGKDNIEELLIQLINKYPNVIKAIPFLLAIRLDKYPHKTISIIDDISKFTYKDFNFSENSLFTMDSKQLAQFFIKTGLGDILKDKKVKNLVDYATGVEVGLDSNGRKNRGGHQMENAVEFYINLVCEELDISYLKEANAKTIKETWGIEIAVDKSSRRIDYVINNNGKLFFFEVNFYNGGGSKLKSTATEYVKMNEYWNDQNIEFIWVTDGAGWLSTLKPLREYFDKADYLLNLEILSRGIIKKILADE